MPMSASGTSDLKSNAETRTRSSVSNGSQSNTRTDRAPSSPSRTSSPQGSDSKGNKSGSYGEHGSDPTNKDDGAREGSKLPEGRVTKSLNNRNPTLGNADKKVQYGVGTARQSPIQYRDPQLEGRKQQAISKLLDSIKAKPIGLDPSIMGRNQQARTAEMTGPGGGVQGGQGITGYEGGPAGTPQPDETRPDPRFNVGVLDAPRLSADPTNGVAAYPGAGVPDLPNRETVINKTPGPRVNISSLLDKISPPVGQPYGMNIPQAEELAENVPFPQQNPLRDTTKIRTDATFDARKDFGTIDAETLSRLAALQEKYNKPITITEGSAPAGTHVKRSEHHIDPATGKSTALDMSVPREDRAEVARLANEAGFGGIGAYNSYPNMVHVDAGPVRSWGPGGRYANIGQLADADLRKALTQREPPTVMAAADDPPPKRTVMNTVVPAVKEGVKTGVNTVKDLLAEFVPTPRPKPQATVPLPREKPAVPSNSPLHIPTPRPKPNPYARPPAAPPRATREDLQNIFPGENIDRYFEGENAPEVTPAGFSQPTSLYDMDFRTPAEKVAGGITDRFKTVTDPVQRLVESIFGAPTGDGRQPEFGQGGAEQRDAVIETPHGNTDINTLLDEMQAAGLPQQQQMNLILSIFA